jgi:hypothetical protein
MGGYPPQGGGMPVALKELAVGTLTANGTEQTVIETADPGEVAGWIDLSNMQEVDSVTIRLYVKLKKGGDYKLNDLATKDGAQSYPALCFLKYAHKYGLKITFQQTAGTYRTFDYNLFLRP